MELGLAGKRVFISGSSAGIGLAMAKEFIVEKAEIILNSRTEESLVRTLDKFRAEFPKAKISGFPADFTKQKEVSQLVNKLGTIDILINNVGIYTSKRFEDTSYDDWLKMWTVNVMSGVALSKALLPGMIHRNSGRIIFVSSECAELAPSDLIAYSSTKAALLALSRGLAQLCRKTNVTVNAVLPGSTKTEGAEIFLENLAKSEGRTIEEAERDFFIQARSNSIVQRFLKPEEIAKPIVFLASDHSNASNGASIRLDGGSIAGI